VSFSGFHVFDAFYRILFAPLSKKYNTLAVKLFFEKKKA